MDKVMYISLTRPTVMVTTYTYFPQIHIEDMQLFSYLSQLLLNVLVHSNVHFNTVSQLLDSSAPKYAIEPAIQPYKLQQVIPTVSIKWSIVFFFGFNTANMSLIPHSN